MLYDPKWEKKNDLQFKGVTLSAFIAWLATKPADEEYDYCEPHKCAVAQYRKNLGRREPYVSFPPPGSGGRGCWLQDIVIQHPWTFGAALERARSVAAR